MQNKFFETFNIPPRLEYHTNCFVCDWYDGYWTHQLYNPFNRDDLKTILKNDVGEQSRFYTGDNNQLDKLKVLEVKNIYPKITPQIILNLEDVALNCDYLLTKRPSDELLGDDLYLWSNTTNMQDLHSTAHKNRKDAVLHLLTIISEWHDIQEEVRMVFNAK